MHNTHLQNQFDAANPEVTVSVSVRVHLLSLASPRAHLGKSPAASAAEGGATWPSHAERREKCILKFSFVNVSGRELIYDDTHPRTYVQNV